jgi:hypothetical protein
VGLKEQVDEAIEALREKFSVASDAELARRFGIDKSTISTWRSRGRIPSRYTILLADDDSEDARGGTVGGFPNAFHRNLILSDMERAALKLALFRYLDEAADAAGDFSRMLEAASAAGAQLWLRAGIAYQDIAQRTRPGLSPDEVAALIMYEDLNPPKE